MVDVAVVGEEWDPEELEQLLRAVELALELEDVDCVVVAVEELGLEDSVALDVVEEDLDAMRVARAVELIQHPSMCLSLLQQSQ